MDDANTQTVDLLKGSLSNVNSLHPKSLLLESNKPFIYSLIFFTQKIILRLRPRPANVHSLHKEALRRCL